MVMAPAASSFSPQLRSPAGSRPMHRPITAAPSGTLTRKIQCQLKALVSRPLATTPMLPPQAHTKP